MTTSDKYPDHPECFGNLETVFPMGPEGLRCSPDACMSCVCKTECLRTAMERPSGIEVHEEMVDRAYTSGKLGFIERWSKRKTFSRKKHQMKKDQY